MQDIYYLEVIRFEFFLYQLRDIYLLCKVRLFMEIYIKFDFKKGIKVIFQIRYEGCYFFFGEYVRFVVMNVEIMFI